MKVVPLGDKVVVKPFEAEAVSSGGIALPEGARLAQMQGKVLSVGDGTLLSDGRRAEHQVHEGDRVVYRNYSGTEVVVDGEELLILSEADILAIMQ